jgi:hypothetical protein
MTESKFIETLVERYLNNQATEAELAVFLDLLRQGKLDNVLKTYMDKEIETLQDTSNRLSSANVFKPWLPWMKVAASVFLILW